MKKITEEQKKAMERKGEEWKRIALSTGPADRKRAREAISGHYKAHGIEVPDKWVYARSPLEGLHKMLEVEDEYLKSKGEPPPDVPEESRLSRLLAAFGYGAQDANWLVVYDIYHEILGVDISPNKIEGLLELAKVAGWWMPTRQAVLVCDNPIELHHDGVNTHRDGGPAIAYADGWKIHLMHGVMVPDWLAETPAGKLRAQDVLSIENIEARKIGVEKMGLDCLLSQIDAKVLDQEEEHDYKLYDADIGIPASRGEGTRRVRILYMQNASLPEVSHVEYVGSDCKTVEQAIQWRAGLKPEQIDAENGAEWIQQGDVLFFPEGAKTFKPRPSILT